jgi:hypothetical protein
MKYMLLIQHGDMPVPGSPEWDALSEDEQKAIGAGYQAVDQTEGVTPGVWMESPETATTVRVENGETLTTDGPFVAVKEALGGYLFFEAENLNAAIELATRIRAARLGGAVKIRPVKEGYRASSRSSARNGAVSSRRWSASWATSNSPRKPPRKRSRSPPSGGRATVSRIILAPGW